MRYIATFIFESPDEQTAIDTGEVMSETFCNQDIVTLELGMVRTIEGEQGQGAIYKTVKFFDAASVKARS